MYKYSFIIPTQNRPEECFQTFLKLKKVKNCQIVVVQNGSTDSNVKKYNNLFVGESHFISICNVGVSQARNYGLNCSKGEWVFFLDDDDEITDEFIEFLNTNNSSSLLGVDVFRFQINIRGRKIGKNGSNDLWGIAQPSSFLIKKDFLLKNQFFFNEQLKYAEDQMFALQIYKSNPSIKWWNLSSIFYNTSNNSITRVNKKSISSNSKVLDFLDVSNPKDSTIFLKVVNDIISEKKYYDNYEYKKFKNRIRKIQLNQSEFSIKMKFLFFKRRWL